MQIERLLAAGVHEENIYSENMSGAKDDRPELLEALKALRDGDTFVVWKFDRAARSIRHLLKITDELKEKNVKFVSLTEGIDTTTTIGNCFLMMIGLFAQLELDMIAERTRAGVKKAQAEGVRFGAPHKITPEQMPEIWIEVNEKRMTKAAVAKKYQVTVQTISRRLKEYEKSKSQKI